MVFDHDFLTLSKQEQIMQVISRLIIRNERPDDYSSVEFMTREAFWNVYCPGATEHFLLHVMRSHPSFVKELDFVAELDGVIAGNVVFAEAHIEMDNGASVRALSMGPIAVAPSCQRRGIGRRLVAHAIDRAAEMDYAAIALCGDPDLYGRYGFEQAEKYGIRNADNNYSPALHIHWLKAAEIKRDGRYYESDAYEFDTEALEAYDRRFPLKEKISGTPSQLRFDEIVAMAKPFETGK